jgi:hypothetical protein
MEKLEKLFQRKHNQLNEDEMNAVNAYRKIIASRITHVIDCEAYSNFTSNADLVAYKGGDIERNLLNNMGVQCINLEVLTCPKYVDLLTKYGYQQECCPYHIAQSYHCSRHEVKVFTQFIEELIV